MRNEFLGRTLSRPKSCGQSIRKIVISAVAKRIVIVSWTIIDFCTSFSGAISTEDRQFIILWARQSTRDDQYCTQPHALSRCYARAYWGDPPSWRRPNRSAFPPNKLEVVVNEKSPAL